MHFGPLSELLSCFGGSKQVAGWPQCSNFSSCVEQFEQHSSGSYSISRTPVLMIMAHWSWLMKKGSNGSGSGLVIAMVWSGTHVSRSRRWHKQTYIMKGEQMRCHMRRCCGCFYRAPHARLGGPQLHCFSDLSTK